MKIRRAEVDDLLWIDGQLPRMEAEAMPGLKHSQIPKDEKTRDLLLLRLKNDHILLVAETGKELVGFVAVSVGPHALNPEMLVANEHLYWVVPEARKGRAGVILLNAAIMEATARGVQWIWWFSQIANGAPGNGALRRRGFQPRECQWLLELDTEESGV